MTQSQILVLAFWFLIIYRECTLLPALAESCSVADSKGLRILTTFFIMFLSLSVILFFSVCDVWRRIKETRTSRRDSLITWEEERQHRGLWKLHCCSVLDNRYKNHFFQDWEKRGCSACNIALLTTLIILKLCKFGDNPLNLQAFKNPW